MYGGDRRLFFAGPSKVIKKDREKKSVLGFLPVFGKSLSPITTRLFCEKFFVVSFNSRR
jgi:hypothetical protein